VATDFQNYNKDYQPTIALAYKAATYRFLQNSPKNTDRLIEIVDEAIKGIDSGRLGTVEAVAVFVRQSIDYSKITPTEALLLDDLIGLVNDQMKQYAAQSMPLDEIQAALKQRLSYIRQAGQQFKALQQK